MAERNYFRHVARGRGINIMIHEAGYRLADAFLDNPARNNFESITRGTIRGGGDHEPHHLERSPKTLLGLSEFWATHSISASASPKSGSRYRILLGGCYRQA